MDNRTPTHRISHAPTMLIRTSPTAIAKVDPLKKAFRKLFEFLPPHARGHVVAGIGEFMGTIVFLFMAFSAAQVALISSNNTKKGNIDAALTSVSPAELLYISMGAGVALAVSAWSFFRISGGLFNPAVSIGMGLIGALTWARVAILCVVQTVATIVAAYMASALFPGGLNVGTALHPHVSLAQGLVIEMLLTAQLVFTIFMLAAEKHDATPLAPLGIGLSLFVAEMIGVFWTGGSLNPARSLAPAIVTRSFPSYHWIYWVGPMAGSFIAVLLYKLIKALEYETAQDADDEDEGPLLPKSTRKEPENPSTVALSAVDGAASRPPAPSPQHLAPTTYTKTPFVHDKESENERKHSVLRPVPSEDGSVDVLIFKVPAVLRTDMDYLTARYASKLRTNPAHIESTGQAMNREQLPKFRPIVKTNSESSAGRLSANSRLDKMDFQCRGLGMNPEHQPAMPSGLRYDTESTAYYSTKSGLRRDSVVKRQGRIRSPTDEISEVPKKVTWSG